MAIFRLNAAIISASTGSSAVRAAAYRHAVRMVSHAFTETTSFTRNAQAMVHAEVALPEDAPEWAENAFGHAAFADALRLVRADVQAQAVRICPKRRSIGPPWRGYPSGSGTRSSMAKSG